MIAAIEDLIAQCTSACIRGHLDLAEKICYKDLPVAVEVLVDAGTEDAISAGIDARQRMEEILDMYFPE